MNTVTVRPGGDEIIPVEASKPFEKRKEKFAHSAAAKRPTKKKPKDKPKRCVFVAEPFAHTSMYHCVALTGSLSLSCLLPWSAL